MSLFHKEIQKVAGKAKSRPEGCLSFEFYCGKLKESKPGSGAPNTPAVYFTAETSIPCRGQEYAFSNSKSSKLQVTMMAFI